MVFYRRWLLIFCALILGGGAVMASSSREERAYAAAVTSFQTEMWSRAEQSFGQFAQRYPDSTNTPMAVLLQAQAQFNEGKLTEAINLLTLRKPLAGNIAD
ncbi:MAG TPA: outer membrane protein assembly factor BamD, partial [Verrucomicrobiae bacterium]|nr:outer membrane protein assembly factor BamD [Verrucomicrobiae bacterium]